MTDFKSEMRDVLEKNIHYTCSNPPRGIRAEDIGFKVCGIDTALSSLLALIEKRLPKERYCEAINQNPGEICDEHCLSILNCQNNIRNQCLSEIRKEMGI